MTIEGFSGLIETTRGGRADVETGSHQEELTIKNCSKGHYRSMGWPSQGTTVMKMTSVPTLLRHSLKIQTLELIANLQSPTHEPASC